ncbi:MAG: hypothetical protein LBS68_03170, partial [Puniceicoccales bacterium]|nr:hypothetical protein [Puniceicoccales bacterium]
MIFTGDPTRFPDPRVGYVYGGYTQNGNYARGNFVTIGGTVTGYVEIYGGRASLLTFENTVTISGGSAEVESIIGGYNDNHTEYNTITITEDSEVKATEICGGATNDGSVIGNKIYISGSGTTVGSASKRTNIYGGSIFVRKDTYSDIPCTRNVVEISGGTITADICGGHGRYYNASYDRKDRAVISDNIVRILGGLGAIDLTDSNLYGWGGEVSTIHSNNMLHVDNWCGTVKSIQNFDRFHFTLPEDVADGDLLLQVSETASWPDGTLVTIDFAGDETGLEFGDSITLIQADELTAGTLCADRVVAFLDGNPFAFRLSVDGNSLLATLENVLFVPSGNGYLAAIDRSYFHGIAAAVAGENAGGDAISQVIGNWQFGEAKDIGRFRWFGSFQGDKIRGRAAPGVENKSCHFNVGATVEYKSYHGNFLAGVAAESSLD